MTNIDLTKFLPEYAKAESIIYDYNHTNRRNRKDCRKLEMDTPIFTDKDNNIEYRYQVVPIYVSDFDETDMPTEILKELYTESFLLPDKCSVTEKELWNTDLQSVIVQYDLSDGEPIDHFDPKLFLSDYGYSRLIVGRGGSFVYQRPDGSWKIHDTIMHISRTEYSKGFCILKQSRNTIHHLRPDDLVMAYEDFAEDDLWSFRYEKLTKEQFLRDVRDIQKQFKPYVFDTFDFASYILKNYVAKDLCSYYKDDVLKHKDKIINDPSLEKNICNY